MPSTPRRTAVPISAADIGAASTARAAIARAVIAIAAVMSIAAAARADTLRYQTGFEPSEGYVAGNLIGQHGPAQDPWEQDDGASPFATVTVQSGVVRPSGGLHAVQFTANGAAGNPFADYTDVFTAASGITAAQIAAEPIVTIQWDMMRGVPGATQPATALWGIDIFDAGAQNITATIGAYTDSLGPAVAGTDSLGDFVFLGDGDARGVWGTYTVTMDFTTRHYSVALNGVTLGSPLAFFAAANNGISDVDFLALTRGTDSAYFDNLSISTRPIPEPPAAAFGVMPVFLALSCRRRSHHNLRAWPSVAARSSSPLPS